MKRLLAIFLILMLSFCGCAEEATVIEDAGTFEISDLLSLLDADKPLVRFLAEGLDVGVFAAMNDAGELELRYATLSEYPLMLRFDEYGVYAMSTGQYWEFEGALMRLGELSLVDFDTGEVLKVGVNSDGELALVRESGEIFGVIRDTAAVYAKSMTLTIDMDILTEAIDFAWELQKLLPTLSPSEEDVLLLDSALGMLQSRLRLAGLDFDMHQAGETSYRSFSFDPARIQLGLMGFVGELLAQDAGIDALIGRYAPVLTELFGDVHLFDIWWMNEEVYLSNLSAEHLKNMWMYANRELEDYTYIPVVDVQIASTGDSWTLDARAFWDEGDCSAMLNLSGVGGAFDGELRLSDTWYEELYIIDVDGFASEEHVRLRLLPRGQMEDFDGLLLSIFNGEELHGSLSCGGISANLYGGEGLLKLSVSTYNESTLEFSVGSEVDGVEIVFADYWNYRRITLSDGTLTIYQ